MQVQAQAETTCLECKSPIAPGARFCSSCGVATHAAAPAVMAPQPGARKVCPGCSKIADPAAQFCLRCGTKLPDKATVPAFGEPAGLGVRALAAFVDVVVHYSLGWWAVQRLGSSRMTMVTIHRTTGQSYEIPWLLPGLLIGLFCCTLMVGAWGASFGKLLCGLRVVRGDGGRVTYGVSFTRYFAAIVSTLVLGLGNLWMLLSPRKKAWHDYLCDTRVVYKRPS